MVKEINESLIITGVSAETFIRLIYLDVSLLRRFHAEINHDPNATVPQWEPTSRERTLEFTTPLAAPPIIQRLVGADSIRVIETQTLLVSENSSVYTITSVPTPQMPGASNFISTANLTISDSNLAAATLCGGINDESTATPSCFVSVLVKVEALGPWGLTSTIEAFMATAAQDSLQQFLSYCQRYVAQLLETENALETMLHCIPTAPSSFPDVLQEREEDEEERLPRLGISVAGSDVFVDAAEEPLPPSRPTTPIAADFVGIDINLESEAVVVYLKHLVKCAEENNDLLRSIDDRLSRYTSNTTSSSSLDVVGQYVVGAVKQNTQGALLVGIAATSILITSLFWNYRHHHVR